AAISVKATRRICHRSGAGSTGVGCAFRCALTAGGARGYRDHMPSDPPRLAVVHESEVPWQEVLAQRHGERRVSVHEKFLEWTADRMVVLGRYDPGVVVERHGHKSDHLVYVLEGDLVIGDRHCPAGTLVVLEVGAVFGPLVAG